MTVRPELIAAYQEAQYDACWEQHFNWLSGLLDEIVILVGKNLQLEHRVNFRGLDHGDTEDWQAEARLILEGKVTAFKTKTSDE